MFGIERVTLPCLCGRRHRRWRIAGWRWDKCRHLYRNQRTD